MGFKNLIFKKSQQQFVEFLLIISLTIFALVYSYYWFLTQKDKIINIVNSENIKYDIKFLATVLENSHYLWEDSEIVKIKSVFVGYCSSNYVVLKTYQFCTPIINTSLTFTGYLININNQTYFYSNQSKKYFTILPIYPNIYYGCIDGRESYIIPVSKCMISCKNVCILKIKKNESGLYILNA